MNKRSTRRQWLARAAAALAVAAVALACALAPLSAAADDTPSYLSVDESSKTITVSNDDSTTTEIQDAIDYIEGNADDKDGWTVLVATGLYSTYTVPDGVGVTVMAQDSTQLVAVSDDINFTVDETGISVDASSKTVTVSDAEGEDYEIQNAIDYISTQSDVIGWTIVVKSGTYARFVVYDGMDDLTVEAADGADVTVSVLDGSEMQIVDYTFINNKGTLSYYYYDANGLSEDSIKNDYRGDHWQQGFYDNDGVVIMCADGVTISGLTFQMGSAVTTWPAAAISTMSSALENGTANDFTIESCTFISSGSSDGAYGIFVASGDDSWVSTWKIDGCTFTNVCYGIGIMLDNFVTQATITNNTFTGCVDAIENGYACNYKSVSTEDAYLTVTGNTITGTASTHTKVCILDGNNSDALGTVTITGNTLEHVNLLLCSIDTTVAEIYASNAIGECSWVLVTEMSHDTESNDTSVSFVASTESGYWELVDDDSSISENDLAYIEELIEAANASGATTLTVDLTKFTDTAKLTSEPDGVKLLKTVINWVSTTSVTVTKTWDDSDDADGIRPESVTVELYQNGEATGLTATLSEDNDWTATFDSWSEDYVGLPVHDEGGTTDYTYSVVEEAVAVYETSYSDVTGSNEDGWAVTVTNTHEYVTVDVTVSKVWDDGDDEDGIRPDSVTVELYADGVATGLTVVLSEENGWTATFSDLPAYSYDEDCNATEVAYTVEEVAVEGYSASLTGVTFSLGSLVVEITNTHEVVTTSVAVAKVWDDGDDADGIRPDSVTISLYADGEDTGLTVTLSEDNGWAATFEGLAAYTYDEDGDATEVAYAIAEVDVPEGYAATYSDFSGSVEEGYSITVTNTHEVTAEEESEDEVEDEDEVTAEEETEEESEEETAEVPDTGDATSLTWAASAVAGLAAVAGAVALRRRARR